MGKPVVLREGIGSTGYGAVLKEYARLARRYDWRWSFYIEAGVKEMLRVLRPGGSLVITDWCDDYLACRVCDRVLRVLSAAHFRTYRERECRELLQAAGVGAVLTQRYKINWLWGL